jgi:hypothetical protein
MAQNYGTGHPISMLASYVNAVSYEVPSIQKLLTDANQPNG